VSHILLLIGLALGFWGKQLDLVLDHSNWVVTRDF
jgi:hypothetical protein